MPRCNILALPVELLTEICKTLCWHCCRITRDGQCETDLKLKDQLALLSLSRTCKALRITVQPFLYHGLYTLREMDLYFFVRTLSERPDLGLSVFEVDVTHHTYALTSGPCQAGEAQIQSLGTQSELRQTSEYGAMVLLLLQLTPNLERARFWLPCRTFFKTFAPSDLSLRMLKRLDFDGIHGYLLDTAAPVLRLAPNLQVLHSRGCAEVTSDFLTGKIMNDPSPLQNLTELDLTASALTVASMRNLLSTVGPMLAKIRIEPISLESSVSVELDVLKFDEVLAVLRPWSQTLRELSFCLYGSQLPRHLRGIHLLREFRALEILRAEAAFFPFYRSREALTSTLPPSLCELRLLGYSHLVPALQCFFVNFQAGNFPSLSRIEIDDQDYDSGSFIEQELRQVGVDFAAAGVNFIVHPQPQETGEAESV
ncbi:hypothetical protein F5Y06DRAFT_32889 [Hypoxylon sp. FL0890]|nr:hypothetical protein F5Y06DRAFT_32889 [Hypoxylon sp. FL0890]